MCARQYVIRDRLLRNFFFLDKYDRKGSSDSLSSQKNGDSHSVVPVKETLHKAKKQIQAIMGTLAKRGGGGGEPERCNFEYYVLFTGVSKKCDSTNAHSDSEVDDFSITAWNKQSEFPVPRKPLPSRSAHLSSEPTAPARYSRRREILCKSVTEEIKPKETENRFTQANSYNSIMDASALNLRTNNTHRLVFRC